MEVRDSGFSVHAETPPQICVELAGSAGMWDDSIDAQRLLKGEKVEPHGRTRAEARAMAEDAIRCVLESAQNAGEPIPEDITSAAERLAISMPNS